MTARHAMSAVGYWRSHLDREWERTPLRAQARAKFITISRQAGTGAIGLSHTLAQHLSQLYSAEPPWKAYDRELINRVTQEHQIPGQLVEEVMDGKRSSWIEDFFTGLVSNFSLSDEDHPTEAKVYRRVVQTIRALAEQGRCIIVGRGGVYITRDLPDGLHVRLVAPLAYRVQRMAESLGISREEAADRVAALDAQRDAFYKRYWYWQGDVTSPEMFTVTINVTGMDQPQLIQCLTSLVMSAAEVKV